MGIRISSPKHPGYTERRGGQKPNVFQTSVRGASFTAPAAPKPLLHGQHIGVFLIRGDGLRDMRRSDGKEGRG